jgi:hypothetical protein
MDANSLHRRSCTRGWHSSWTEVILIDVSVGPTVLLAFFAVVLLVLL